MDLPEPLTPVTHVSVFERDVDVDVLQVVLGGAREPDLLRQPRRRGDGTGIASSSRRYFAVSDRGSCSSPSSVARVDDPAALLAGAEPEVDDVVGDANHVRVVLDDEHGIALVAKLPEDRR